MVAKGGDLRLGETNSQVKLIEHGIVILEEGDAHDPEGTRTIHVHGHYFERTHSTFTLDVVLGSQLIFLTTDNNFDCGVFLELFISAGANEEVVEVRICIASVVLPDEVILENPIIPGWHQSK